MRGIFIAAAGELADLAAVDEIALFFRIEAGRRALAPVEDLALGRKGEADRPVPPVVDPHRRDAAKAGGV